jgi:urea-proton symporter
MAHDEANIRKFSKGAMVLLVIFGVAIANIPGITIVHLFLFYGTLRASTLLPTVVTLLSPRRHVSRLGMFWGILVSLFVGLPVFGWGSIQNLADWKIAGSLISVGASGLIVIICSLLRVR